MIKKLLLILLLFSLFYTQNREWSTTRFDKWWNTSFNHMQFRDPISFLPYKIKIGTYYYGDKDYFKFIKNNSLNDNLEDSPFISDNNLDFSLIKNNLQYRKGLAIEVDFLSYNFFKKLQNTIDIQLGFSYKFNQVFEKALVEPNWIELNNSSLYLRPTFHSLGFKTHYAYQWHPKFYNYFYYTHSYLYASLLEDIHRESLVNGSGESSSIGLGFSIIKNLENKDYDLHYGFELSINNMNINKIKNELSHIVAFNSQNIKINFSIGIGYGGNKSVGDFGYANMIDGEYIEAVSNFEKFIDSDIGKYKKPLAKTMIDFSNSQIAYDMFYKGVNSNDIDDAIYWYNKALLYANENLKYEINLKKYIIAYNLLGQFEKSGTIDESINHLNKIKSISKKIEDKVNSRIADFLYEKGEFMISQNQYQAAIDIFREAQILFPNKEFVFNGKMNLLVSHLIGYINQLVSNAEYIKSYNYLILLNEIYLGTKDILSEDIVNFKETIENNTLNKINRLSQIIIEKSKDKFLPEDDFNFIKLGDSYSKIIRLFGTPVDYIIKDYDNAVYTMMIYEFGDKVLRFYFKDNNLFGRRYSDSDFIFWI